MRLSLSPLLLAAAVLTASSCSNGHAGPAQQAAAPAYTAPPSAPAARSCGASAPAARACGSSAATRSAPPPVTPPRAAQPAYAPSAGGPVPFDAHDIPYDQALAAGRAAGKPVAFYILSSTCGYCSRLENSTLTDGGVQAEMRRFYNVRIDSRSAAGVPIAQQYARSGYPQTTIVDSSGAVRGSIIGYEDASRYAGDLRRVQ
jgi:hypothetical protein